MADPLGAAAWAGPGAGGGSIAGRALAALNPGRRAVIALGAVGLVVALVVAFVVYRAQPRAVPVAPLVTSARPGPAPAVTAAPVATGSGPVATGSGSPESIVVAVTGRVRHPGLVRLPAGARVADAIAAAGGALPGTDLSFVNLAAKVVDGQLIAIGVTPPPGTTLGPDGGPGGGGAGPVNLNTATLTDLETLPGIGPTLAQRILDYRSIHHGFHSVDELRQVSGIGDAKFAELKDLVTV